MYLLQLREKGVFKKTNKFQLLFFAYLSSDFVTPCQRLLRGQNNKRRNAPELCSNNVLFNDGKAGYDI